MAVGLEQLGVEEFIERKFFDGGKNNSYVPQLPTMITEIYIDEKKQCYKDLGYKRWVVTTRTVLST